LKGLNEFLQGAEGKQWLQGYKGEQWLQTAIGKEWKKQQQNATSKSTETPKDGTLQQSNAKTEKFLHSLTHSSDAILNPSCSSLTISLV
jgi:hypothetical protein